MPWVRQGCDLYPCSSDQIAVCPLLIGTVHRECVDRMIIVDRRHLKAVFYELEAPKSQLTRGLALLRWGQGPRCQASEVAT